MSTDITPAPAKRRCVCGYDLDVMPCPYHGYDRVAPSNALSLAWEAVDALGEVYAETRAEHEGECARFGDSWPGAAIQVANLYAALVEAEAEAFHLASVEGFLADHGPELHLVTVYSDDEPF